MKALVAGVTLGVMFAQPASACHRFHVWRYPYPQRCGGSYEHQGRVRVPVVRVNPPVVASVRRVYAPELGFKLPLLVDDLAWDMPLETRTELELYEEIQRKAAILRLSHGE